MDTQFDQIRASNSRRSLSLLVVVALALQGGFGLGETSALLRESSGQTTAIRALAEAVVRYASKPVRVQEERPARVSARELGRGNESGASFPVVLGTSAIRMLPLSLIALPPPQF
ncbi:MAG: hypothetical protein KF691_08965 [Phycisphaeraceae bacterium]|nr:hypothetical protein [Phycisphaeraceae bacterium]